MSIADTNAGTTVSGATTAKVLEFLVARLGAFRGTAPLNELIEHLNLRNGKQLWEALEPLKTEGLLITKPEACLVRLSTTGWEEAKRLPLWGKRARKVHDARQALANALRSHDGSFAGTREEIWKFIAAAQSVVQTYQQLLALLALARSEDGWMSLVGEGPETLVLEKDPPNDPAAAQQGQAKPVMVAVRVAIANAIRLTQALKTPEQPPVEASTFSGSEALKLDDNMRLRLLLEIALQGGTIKGYDSARIAETGKIPNGRGIAAIRALQMENLVYLVNFRRTDKMMALLTAGAEKLVALLSNDNVVLKVLINPELQARIATALEVQERKVAEANNPTNQSTDAPPAPSRLYAWLRFRDVVTAGLLTILRLGQGTPRQSEEAAVPTELEKKIARARAVELRAEKGNGPYLRPTSKSPVHATWVLSSLWKLVELEGHAAGVTMTEWHELVALPSTNHANSVVGWMAHWEFIERISHGAQRGFWLTQAGVDFLVRLLEHEAEGTLNDSLLPSMDRPSYLPVPTLQLPRNLGMSAGVFLELELQSAPSGWQPSSEPHSGNTQVSVAHAVLFGEWLAQEAPQHAHFAAAQSETLCQLFGVHVKEAIDDILLGIAQAGILFYICTPALADKPRTYEIGLLEPGRRLLLHIAREHPYGLPPHDLLGRPLAKFVSELPGADPVPAPEQPTLKERIAKLRALQLPTQPGDGPYSQPKATFTLTRQMVFAALSYGAENNGLVSAQSMNELARVMEAISSSTINFTLGWLAYWECIERKHRHGYWLTSKGVELLIQLLEHEAAGTLDEAPLPNMDPVPPLNNVPQDMSMRSGYITLLTLTDPPAGWRPQGEPSTDAPPAYVSHGLVLTAWLARRHREHAAVRGIEFLTLTQLLGIKTKSQLDNMLLAISQTGAIYYVWTSVGGGKGHYAIGLLEPGRQLLLYIASKYPSGLPERVMLGRDLAGTMQEIPELAGSKPAPLPLPNATPPPAPDRLGAITLTDIVQAIQDWERRATDAEQAAAESAEKAASAQALAPQLRAQVTEYSAQLATAQGRINGLEAELEEGQRLKQEGFEEREAIIETLRKQLDAINSWLSQKPAVPKEA